MLRMTPSVSAERAKDYFRLALSRGEYYTESKILNQEIVGHWGGRAAERLGLSGDVDQAAFDNLCDNINPNDGKRLTQRTRDDRRAGYDFNFHVPKSVSLALELGGDRRVLNAFEDAARETMRELEKDAHTRVRRAGANESRTTGELIWAEFVHFTARPVEGVPDPHLHMHVFVSNQTWDPVEERWKAVDLGEIMRDAPYHQAAFHVRLAERLIGLGYDIERRGSAWEIAGIEPILIGAFSRRTEEIEALAKERGIEDVASKAALGARTRAKKLDVASMQELRRVWRDRLSESQRASLEATRKRADRARMRTVNRDEATLDACLGHAEGTLFERASVVPEKRLLAAALQQGVGRITVEQTKEHFETRIARGDTLRGELDGKTMATTPEVLAEEKRMLSAIRDGRGRQAPIKSAHAIEDEALSAEQSGAVRHVLESADSVIMVRGRAGVGKTRLMKEVVNAIETTGRHVAIAAPTAMATHEVLRKEGFDNAQTVARLLKDPDEQRKLKNGVLWVDEAGLLSIPDLARLVQLVETKRCRLLLTGDTRQHRAVLRGDAMRLIETESGLKAAELTTVRRQQSRIYREAAEALSRGDLEIGVERLDAMEAIKEVERDSVAATVAREYAASITSGRSTLIVSPTHAEGREVTNEVRSMLRETGLIAEKEHAVSQLRSRHLSEAERADPARHRVGDVIVFHQNVPGFRKSERATVLAMTDNGVVVRRQRDGFEKALPLSHAKHFESFEKHELSVSVGDVVRITRNGHTIDKRHRLNNGALYRVKSVGRDGSLTFKNGWRTEPNFGHLAHGYCVTSDASQGRTVDKVILAQSSLSEFAGSSQQWYTSLTRGRHAATVVTDDRERLLRAVERDASRVTATELMREAITPPTQRGLRHRGEIGRWAGRRREQQRGREEPGRSQRRSRNRKRDTRGRDRDSGRERDRDR